MKFISKRSNLNGKNVLLRVDLNSNIVDGKVILGERIKQAAESIKFLKRKGARVVVIAHQGRPNGEDFTSLRSHAKFLNKFTKIKFVNEVFGMLVRQEIRSLKNGGAILLENVRMSKEEFMKTPNSMSRFFLDECEVYVNDAFSNSHRNHTSMVGFKGKLPSYAGILLERELKALKKINLKKTLLILGGAKPKEDSDLLGRGEVLACGLFGQTCLFSLGFKFGFQEKYLRKTIRDFQKIQKKIKGKLGRVVTPVDFGVKVKGKRKDLNLTDFPSKYEIFDVGPNTLKIFVEKIRGAKSIYMKGPVGDFSSKGFEKGTFEVLRAIASSRAFSLIGGGHLSNAITKSKISVKKFGHVSLSGGALLEYILGKKLPGLVALG